MRRRTELGLILAGLACLLLFCNSYLKYQIFQSQSQTHEARPILSHPVTYLTNSHPIIGRLSIPRLGFTVVVVEGDDDQSLEVAAGHMPGTALPGQSGNMIVAGHRDSAFWPLRNIRAGDLIDMKGDQSAVYRVHQLQVVGADDVNALADTKNPMLTLVTCYPFRHVGPAPQRFIVRAKLVKADSN